MKNISVWLGRKVIFIALIVVKFFISHSRELKTNFDIRDFYDGWRIIVLPRGTTNLLPRPANFFVTVLPNILLDLSEVSGPVFSVQDDRWPQKQQKIWIKSLNWWVQTLAKQPIIFTGVSIYIFRKSSGNISIILCVHRPITLKYSEEKRITV